MNTAMLRRCFLLVSAITLAFSPACVRRRTRTVEVGVPVEPAGNLIAILVTPFGGVMIRGTTLPFRATGIFDDATISDLTEEVIWSSSSEEVATVSNDADSRGRVTGDTAGEATITATLDAVSGSTGLIVTEAALVLIQVTPCDPSIEVGASIEFSATGIFQNGITQDISDLVSWSESDDEIASIENEGEDRGFAQGLNPGEATITATRDAISGSTSLRVTEARLVAILLDPTHDVVPRGTSVQFHATGFFDNGILRDITGEVFWSTSDVEVAVPDDEVPGLFQALSPGMANIAASLGAARAEAWLTVTAANLVEIAVSPQDPVAPVGTFEKFQASGLFDDGSIRDITEEAVWTSSNGAVAQVSNAAGERGQATALGVGTTAVAAALDGITGGTELTVTASKLVAIRVVPENQTIGAGGSIQFAALGEYEDQTLQDITRQVVWSSSDEEVAVVENAADTKGKAVAGQIGGQTTIVATLADVSGSTLLNVQVTEPTLICVRVSPSLASVFTGQTRQFTAAGFFSDGLVADITAVASWKSDDPQVADVSDERGEKGLATAASPGTARIVAAFGGQSDEGWLLVNAPALKSIKIEPSGAIVEAGGSLQLLATGAFEDGSVADITAQASWASTDPKVASVGDTAADKGLVTGLDGGTIEVQASLDGITGAAGLEVTDAKLLDIFVSPGDPTILKGKEIQFTATGILSNGNSVDLTAQAVWGSSAPSVASVSNEPGQKGLAKGLKEGKSTISADVDGIKGETGLNVKNAKVFKVVVTPEHVELFVGDTQQYKAVCFFTDGTVVDVTASPDLVWETSNVQIGIIGDAPATKGSFKALSPGEVTITATDTVHKLVGTATATIIEKSEQP